MRVLATSRGMEAVGSAAKVIPSALSCVKVRGAANVSAWCLRRGERKGKQHGPTTAQLWAYPCSPCCWLRHSLDRESFLPARTIETNKEPTGYTI